MKPNAARWTRVGRLRRTGEADKSRRAAATPQDGLLRAAEDGRFEALVAEAQPAEPVAMVTPEEREAELRAAGRWSTDEREPLSESRPAAESETPAEPERELTPNEQYIAEHVHWRRRGPNDDRQHVRPGRCLTEYDPLTEEIIGDGYEHYEDEDDDEG
jgi:hypothetical protein